ncbi:MAG: hypothetical protein IPF73_15020 [Betaproteobacteria bacterium]|nr:hypothetical protein [Betaproteobacteria bacterium]
MGAFAARAVARLGRHRRRRPLGAVFLDQGGGCRCGRHGGRNQDNGGLELFAALGADRSIPGMPDPKTLLGEGSREQQMQNFQGRGAGTRQVRRGFGRGQGSPAEASAYQTMLVGVAEKAASASKEGGFLGFGGVRVSDKEQAFITEVKKAVGL